ncbi:MAG: hypothetical protein LBU12_05880 [Deltaproteobacteria bacterium]|jgi:hypothetical protein|nr:hypothetical protein [Deltaproteobacteria bacterium]
MSLNARFYERRLILKNQGRTVRSGGGQEAGPPKKQKQAENESEPKMKTSRKQDNVFGLQVQLIGSPVQLGPIFDRRKTGIQPEFRPPALIRVNLANRRARRQVERSTKPSQKTSRKHDDVFGLQFI